MITRPRLRLATQNAGKIAEIERAIGDLFRIVELPAAFNTKELPETGETLEENALEKAVHVFGYGPDLTMADDTGLEVHVLGGAPGVLSARYAGPAKDPDANMRRLLEEMKGVQDRRARFRTVIALVGPGLQKTFQGEVQGTIGHQPRGQQGFGYDPIFLPEGSDRTFAEMTMDEKRAMSHRERALKACVDFLMSLREQQV